MKHTLQELLDMGGVYRKDGTVVVKYGKHTFNVWSLCGENLYCNTHCYSK